MVTPSPQPGAAPPPPPGVDRALLTLTVVALLVRAAFLVLGPSCAPTGDEPSWIVIGTRGVGRPSRGFSPFATDLVFYPPLYPYFFAVLFRTFHTLRAVKWAQVVLGALLVPAVGRLGEGTFGRRAGLVAAAAVALYPDFVWFSTHFWSETLFVVLLWWGLERLLRSDAAGSTGAAAIAGVLWGLAALTRELTIYLAPIVVLWYVRRGAAAWKRAAAFGLCLVLTVVPWTIRNAVLFRTFIPVSTMGSLNLWQGNTTLTHLQIYEVLANVGGPVEQDRYCRRMAYETIRARQPRWILDKLAEQMPEFWGASSEILDDLVGRTSCGRLPVATVMAVEAAVVGPYLAVLPLFLLGLARVRWTAPRWLLLLLLAAYNLAHVAAYATTRFRLPVLPVAFLLAAAAAVGRHHGDLMPLRGWRLGALVVLCVLAALVLQPGLEGLALWRFLTGRPVA
jgi:hypothetical protein